MRVLLALTLLVISCPALAYIGPGAGVSFLGSIWALLVGVVLAIVAVLFWPIRYLFRRMRRGKSRPSETQNPPQ